MDGVILTPLRRIPHPKGDILHAMKKSDRGFSQFGEAYFSLVNFAEIKGWKKHAEMTLNIVVPMGAIKFVIYDSSIKFFKTVELSETDYNRLTIKPGLWVAFKGLEKNNILLNIASMEHDPAESETKDLNEIGYEW